MARLHGDKLKQVGDLAEEIIILADEGAFECLEESSLLAYGIVRDNAYHIKNTVDIERGKVEASGNADGSAEKA